MDALGIDHSFMIQHLSELLKGMRRDAQSEFIMQIIEGLNVEISQENLIDIIDQAASYVY